MSFWRGLLAARSHLAFVLGLLIAFGAKKTMDRLLGEAPAQRPGLRASLPLRAPAALDEAERAVARDAWAYFARNTRESGLVDSVEGFPSTTLWDQGSALAGMLAARELGLIEESELEARAGKLLEALAQAPLVADALPNRGYDTRTLAPVNYAGQPLAAGAGGWSAIDLGRFGVPLGALAWRSEKLAPRVRKLLQRWKLEQAAQAGELVAGDLESGLLRRRQEGRLGYEQYAAASLALLGIDTALARDFHRHLRLVRVEGREVPADDRDAAQTGGVRAPVLSEPWVLLGLELGLDEESRPLAEAVFAAQEARFRASGTLTAVSEDNLDRAPYFVYSTVFEGGAPWRVYDTAGQDQPALRMLSTKAALGLAALFTGDYADRLEQFGESARVEGKGLHSGRYEADGTWTQSMSVNSCGIALEALAYRVRGPLLSAARLP